MASFLDPNDPRIQGQGAMTDPAGDWFASQPAPGGYTPPDIAGGGYTGGTLFGITDPGQGGRVGGSLAGDDWFASQPAAKAAAPRGPVGPGGSIARLFTAASRPPRRRSSRTRRSCRSRASRSARPTPGRDEQDQHPGIGWTRILRAGSRAGRAPAGTSCRRGNTGPAGRFRCLAARQAAVPTACSVAARPAERPRDPPRIRSWRITRARRRPRAGGGALRPPRAGGGGPGILARLSVPAPARSAGSRRSAAAGTPPTGRHREGARPRAGFDRIPESPQSAAGDSGHAAWPAAGVLARFGQLTGCRARALANCPASSAARVPSSSGSRESKPRTRPRTSPESGDQRGISRPWAERGGAARSGRQCGPTAAGPRARGNNALQMYYLSKLYGGNKPVTT